MCDLACRWDHHPPTAHSLRQSSPWCNVRLDGTVIWLFYNGVLPEGRYAGIRTSMSTAASNPAQFELTWDDSSQAGFATYKFAAIRVLNGLRKEAVRLAADSNKDIDVPRHVYHWLVDSKVPAIREDLGPEAKEKICRLIGLSFQKLGYDAATRLYV